MSKDFFSVIAQELCSIKNSPFSLLSGTGSNKLANTDNQSVLLNNSHIRKSVSLSYDPDRLFQPSKYKDKISKDPQFLQIQRADKQNLQRIQIQLLKERTQEQLKILREKTELFKGHSFTHPFSIFKVDRTVCTACGKCYQYNGNFNIGSCILHQDSSQEIQYLCCLTCACPMNSHAPLTSKNKYSSQIFAHLSTSVIQPHQLNYNFFPLCFIKKQEIKVQVLVNNFYNYLPQLGFQILSYRVLDRRKFEVFQIKRQILTGIEKQTVQKLMRFVQFLQNQPGWNWKQSLPQDIDSDQFQLVKKLRQKLKTSQQIDGQDQVLVFYVRNVNDFNYSQMVNIMNYYSSTFASHFVWAPRETKQMFFSSCLLFPEHFRLNHQIFILPSQQTDMEMEKTSARFKDLLDYNNYTMIGQIKKIQTNKLEEILKFEDTNKLNYIMGRDHVNAVLKRVRIELSAKVGPPIFTIPFKNAVDFIEISSAQKKAPFMMAFPEYLSSQRCLIVLRPCLTLSNFDEIVMTLLRVNSFILLKRRHVILSFPQARYLATLQKIEDSHLDEYIKMMTSGASQVVLVSKRGAIYQANILINGSKDCLSDSKTKRLRDLPSLKMKRGTQSYEYTPTIKLFENQKKQCFSSINQLFKLSNILFQQQFSQPKYLTNQRNGQVIKVNDEKKRYKQYKATSKVKESMLTQIKKDIFNYWAFVSKSQLLTEELATIFMPETTLFQSCVLIVKPGFTHLVQKIRQALAQHRYHIIMQKTVLLSETIASQMITNLSKTKISAFQMKRFVQIYSNQNIHIICVSKVCSKQQIFSILSQFSFSCSRSSIVVDYIDDQILKEVLLPVWNRQQFVLKILSPPLYNIEEAANSLFAPNTTNPDKFQILRYLVGSYYGVSIQDLSSKSVIGKFSYYITSSCIAHQQSWFYSQLSKINPRYVPTLFQHRLIGETCFVIQSHFGQPFLNRISAQYDQEKLKMSQAVHNSERKSLTLFLWGKQLAKFVNSISQKKPQMKGWGKLVKKDQQWQGSYSQEQKWEEQKRFLQQCQSRLQDTEWQIQENINKIVQSRYLKQKFKQPQKKRVIPYFPQNKVDQCIRMIQTQQVSKLHLVDKYSMIDPQHQKHNEKSLYTLALYNAEPTIGTKQELIAQVMMFIVTLQRDNQNYKQMFELLYQYFVQNILQQSQADLVECQFYVRMLKEYLLNNDSWVKNRLRTYPNLRKLVLISGYSNDENTGKKRKFLEKKQYFRDRNSNLTEQQRQVKNKEYTNFNLNYEVQEKQFDKTNPLLNMNDPLHRKFTLQEKTISLLRQGQGTVKQKAGIYVEYQKKISQNQELLMGKVKGQVDKFNYQREQKILYETGLQNQLWYRKTKGQKPQSRQSKVEDAIQKQIGKFIQFKNGSGDNDSYQTR